MLDPVGIGIGSLRTELLQGFKAEKPSIIRGNASEIIALANLWGLESGQRADGVRGVDATDPVEAARQAAVSLARWTGGAVAVSGEHGNMTLYAQNVIDGVELATVARGRKISPRIINEVYQGNPAQANADIRYYRENIVRFATPEAKSVAWLEPTCRQRNHLFRKRRHSRWQLIFPRRMSVMRACCRMSGPSIIAGAASSEQFSARRERYLRLCSRRHLPLMKERICK